MTISWIWTAVCIWYCQIIQRYTIRISIILDTMVSHVTKQLNSKKSIQTHEKEEEKGDIVNLLTGSLKDLVNLMFWHVKGQVRSNESDHDQWSRGSETRPFVILWNLFHYLKAMESNRYPVEKYHNEVKLTPPVLEIGVFSPKSPQSHLGKHLCSEGQSDKDIYSKGYVDEPSCLAIGMWSVGANGNQ